VLLSTPHHDDFIKIWGFTVSTAIADLTGVQNLCDISIDKAEDVDGRLSLWFSIVRKELDQTNKDSNAIQTAVNNGSFLTALRQRGLPIIGDEMTLVTAHVKDVIGM
jgi:hypothetical protein